MAEEKKKKKPMEFATLLGIIGAIAPMVMLFASIFIALGHAALALAVPIACIIFATIALGVVYYNNKKFEKANAEIQKRKDELKARKAKIKAKIAALRKAKEEAKEKLEEAKERKKEAEVPQQQQLKAADGNVSREISQTQHDEEIKVRSIVDERKAKVKEVKQQLEKEKDELEDIERQLDELKNADKDDDLGDFVYETTPPDNSPTMGKSRKSRGGDGGPNGSAD
jgi:Skp family chaperone for outer membrane proteins